MGHQRPHVGVDDRRRGALVLLLLAQDLARERDRNTRQLRAKDLADPALVTGFDVGVEQAHGDRLRAREAQRLRDRTQLVLVERSHDLPESVERSESSKRRWRGTSEAGFVQKLS